MHVHTGTHDITNCVVVLRKILRSIPVVLTFGPQLKIRERQVAQACQIIGDEIRRR